MNVNEIMQKAMTAGEIAASTAVPNPMVVVGEDNNGNRREDYVSEGLCGFAWVKVRLVTKENRAFISGIKKSPHKERWSKAYGGGYSFWVHYKGTQSVTRKSAYADAFAGVLESNGIEAYSDYRLD